MSLFKFGLIGKTPPGKLKDIFKHLTREKIKKPTLPEVFRASDAQIPEKTLTRDMFKEAQERFKNAKAGGGMLVQPGFDGTRQGYSGEYGPNIRKLTKTDSFEVQAFRGGKGGQKFYKTFNFDKYGGEKKALKAAKEYRDSITKIKKDTGKFAKGRPVGSKLTTGGQAEIRKALNNIIKVGGESFSNEDIRKLVDMDLFPDDDQFRKAVDVVKKEPAFKNLKFKKKQKDRLDFFTDPVIRKTIKENYKKLKQENLAKLVFPDEPLTTSKSRLNIILSDMVDKGEIERLAVGKASEERIAEFDPSPEAEKKAKLGRRRRKKINILGAKDYEKELFDFKKEVQSALGLEKVKKGKFDPIDMGHQSSIKQLKALKQSLRPEDLSPQFYKANQLGIQKYEGGVKTLENSLDRKFYPEQKKLYNQAKKFVDAGQEIPADLQNKIIKSNERIQIFIDDTVKKYPLLRDRVNAVTINPINLDVKRGENVFRQLGIGLVDQDLGKIKTGSLDDLTIKANLAEQTLKEATDAGLIDKNIGRQRLDKFLNVRTLKDVDNTIAELASEIDPSGCGRKTGATGGRVGLRFGSTECAIKAKNYLNQAIGRGVSNEPSARVSLIKRIISGAGNFIKQGLNPSELFKLENLVGKPVLYATAAIESGLLADDVLRKKEPINVAAAENFLVGNLLNLDADAERAKNIINDPNLSPAAKTYAQGIIDQNNFRKLSQTYATNLVKNPLFIASGAKAKADTALENLKNKITNTPETGRMDYESLLADKQDAFTAKEKPFDAPDKPGLPSFTSGQLEKRNVPGEFVIDPSFPLPLQKEILVPSYVSPSYSPERPEYETNKFLNQYLKSIGQKPLRPGEGTFFRMNTPQLGLFGTQERFAGGGIAKLAGVDSGPPPSSGPNSQGLQGLMKRVRNR